MSKDDGIRLLPVDPRARRSKDALTAALLDLMAVRDLGQISISDITKHAGVSRSTFYEHYTDVHDLAASACTVVFDELVESTSMIDPQIVGSGVPEDNPLIALFEHFAEHAQLYRSLLGPDGSARVINHLLHRISIRTYFNRRIVGEPPSARADDPSEIPHDPEAALIAGALVGTIIDWVRRDCPGPPQQLASAVWPQLLAATAVNGLPGVDGYDDDPFADGDE